MWKFANKLSANTIISLGIGLLAALVGSFAVLSFVLPADFWGGGNNISGQNQELLKASLGVRAYGRLEVFEFLNNTLPSVAGVYKKKATTSQFVDSLYLEKDRLGSGFVLTSDGWIISDKTVFDSLPAKNAKQYSVISVKNKIYDITSVVYDTWTGVVFIKINAENLPVATLGDSSSLKLGDIVFGGADKKSFWFSYVSGVGYYPASASKSDLIISSEKFSKRIKLQESPANNLSGGLVADRGGDVIGIVVSEPKGNYILPVNYFKNIVSGVLKNKKIVRPYFGASYVDLGSVLGMDLPKETGAYLRSVAIGSPAQKAGLLAGDIITNVNNESFNSGEDLSEMIADYSVGEEMNLKILRDGKEMSIKVVLGSI